jgi:hypothetical protein
MGGFTRLWAELGVQVETIRHDAGPPVQICGLLSPQPKFDFEFTTP